MKRRMTEYKLAVLAMAIAAGLMPQARAGIAAEEQTLTVAGGCFWCVEADFEKVPGVREVVSGYTGGRTLNPDYKKVTAGGTGHYEAVQIFFDPAQVSREVLLSMFLRSVDPTDAGGQFCDRGESYRTAIFVTDSSEQALAQTVVMQAQADLGQTIVTPILPAARFFEAEDYHQDYYKGDNRVLTRFGPIRQSDAYQRYRQGCGRDQRVRQLWGDQAPFAGG